MWVFAGLLEFTSAGAVPPSPAPPPPSLSFSAGFSSDMVLQQSNGTTGAAIYGLVLYPQAQIKVTVIGSASYSLSAVVSPNGNASTWRAELHPTLASKGKEYGILVECTSGCEQAPSPDLNTIFIGRIVYGDVYFCSGQVRALSQSN